MRNLDLEASIWNKFASPEFFERAARESEEIMEWFGTIAISKQAVNFGRNNQIFDNFKQRARDFRRGAELARLGDFQLIWDISDCIRGDVRGMMEQPLHSWMTEAEYNEFSNVKVSRLLAYARLINRALTNAMVGAESFYNFDPDCAGRRNDDDAFPGDEIVAVYERSFNRYKEPLFAKLPDPLPKYLIDKSIACGTGEEVPWTGVWYPKNGLEKHSLTFAVKGLRMQPVYQMIKTVEERQRENDGKTFFRPETLAIATVWHPVIPCGHQAVTEKELRAKGGEPCPKAGIWQPTDVGALPRAVQQGETMANLGSAYGFTVWRWVAEK